MSAQSMQMDSEASSQLWTQDQKDSLEKTQAKKETKAGHGIFNIPFTQIFWVKKASWHMKKGNCLPSSG